MPRRTRCPECGHRNTKAENSFTNEQGAEEYSEELAEYCAKCGQNITMAPIDWSVRKHNTR